VHRQPAKQRLDFEPLERRDLLTVTSVDLNLAGSSAPISFLGNDGQSLIAAIHESQNVDLFKVSTDGATTLLGSFDRLLGELPINDDVIDNAAQVGTDVAFLASINGQVALWKTDGTTAGTVEIARTTADGREISGTLVSAGNMYVGIEDTFVWATDGTAAPVVISDRGKLFSEARATSVGDHAFYLRTVGDRDEMWITDGTATGTQLLIDGYRNTNEYADLEIIRFNGRYYHPTRNGIGAWKYDPATGELIDFEYPAQAFVADEHALFFDSVGEIWQQEPDSQPSSLGVYWPRSMHVSAGNLYIVTSDGSTDTMSVKHLGSSQFERLTNGSVVNEPSRFAELNGGLTFVKYTSQTGLEVWSSDGTADGTQLLDIRPGEDDSFPAFLTTVGDEVLFIADDYVHGREIWRTDGSLGGTQIVADLSQGTNDSSPRLFIEWQNEVLFRANDGAHDQSTWQSDATVEGTSLSESLPGSYDFIQRNGAIFAHSNLDILKSEGGLFVPLRERTELMDLVAVSSDGRVAYTESATIRVIDDAGVDQLIFATPDNRHIRHLVDYEGNFSFFVDDPNGVSLWHTDGSQGGNLEIRSFEYVFEPVFANGLMFFRASTPESGDELWRSDGTSAGTYVVKDIVPSARNSTPAYLTVFEDVVFFAAKDDLHGFELWRSDGSPGGTWLVADTVPGPQSGSPSFLAVAGDALFFAAETESEGMELWMGDGTDDGTHLVADINPGSEGSFPKHFTQVGSRVYFSATQSETGNELWSVAPSTGEVELVVDLWSGPGSSDPSWLYGARDTLFFQAETADIGVELRIYQADRNPPSVWHHLEQPGDINQRDGVSPLDALLVINELNEREFSEIVDGAIITLLQPDYAFDVNNDQLISPFDALIVINLLNSDAARSAPPRAAAAADIDGYHVQADDEDENATPLDLWQPESCGDFDEFTSRYGDSL
jgi:ELWxxDGT repeat protein